MIRRLGLIAAFLGGLAPLTHSRPLLTEEVDTLGKFTFEAGFDISIRTDDFGFPKSTVETVFFPVSAHLGLSENLDVGLSFSQSTQRIKTPGGKLSGSASGQLDLQTKFSPWDHMGFLAVWKTSTSEEEDDLPIGRGNDVELTALFSLPRPWRPQFNIGYVFKGDYDSSFGIRNQPPSDLDPGNIFETKASVEIPIKFNFNLLTELAYYNVASQSINGVKVKGTDGEAMDALVGLTWAWGGWNIGTGVGFGLLEESHTSFDLERGAGDVYYQFSLYYKLKPRPPDADY